MEDDLGDSKIPRSFWVLWFGQSISLLGTSMTGFAMIIWAYSETGSALVLSLSGLFMLVPKMVLGVFGGPLVDRISKKKIMIISDLGAGLCTILLYVLLKNEQLEIWHIYFLNVLNSTFNGFQAPANSALITSIISKKFYVKASGLQSFSDGLVQILAPVLAATVLGSLGIKTVIMLDILTMFFACLSLAFWVRAPLTNPKDSKGMTRSYLKELSEGIQVIRSSALLVRLMLFMAFINLVAGITYLNLLAPLILARTANDAHILALVNASIGLGSVVGALFVVFNPSRKGKVRTIFLCAALSFLFGDILFALGNTLIVWLLAAFLSSFFLPVLNANESYFWRTKIPLELQGRAFSLKYAIQSSVIPLGMLLGGFLAEFVFEPLLAGYFNRKISFLSGPGAGIGLMFLITGVTGTAISVVGILKNISDN